MLALLTCLRTLDAQRRTDEKNANITRADTEGSNALAPARNRAVAEATYQYAFAQAQATNLQSLATASGATGQQVFDYQRAVAQAAWIYITLFDC